MAYQFSSLQLRIMTAAVLIPLVVTGIFLVKNEWYFAIGTGLIFAAGAWEWAKLSHYNSLIKKIAYVIVFGLCTFAMSYYLHIWQILLAGTLFWIMPLIWVSLYRGSSTVLNNPHLRALCGLIVLPTAWLGLNILQFLVKPIPVYLIILLMLIWASDTFAFFAGRLWGKKPLAPHVSPKKTMAGFWGGMVGALCLGALAIPFIDQPPLLIMGVSIVTILLGVLGDLFESLLKRIEGVKDSGTILPGHGGILDRLDSLLAALPFFALILWYRVA